VYTPNLNFKFFKKYIHNGSHIVQKNASNLVVKIDFKVHVCVKSYLEKKRNEVTCMHVPIAFSIPMQFRYDACRGEKGEAVVT